MPAHRLNLLLGGVVILAVVALCYMPVLEPPAGRVPWGSDTLGHVLKVLVLREQLARGVRYPDLMPGWYFGIQMLRYYPPLPYYALLALATPVGDLVWAGNLYLAAAAACGGLGWLALHGRLGVLLATACGALWVILPDHLRVAFAEGNVPRATATALLPLILAALLAALERDSPRPRVALAALVALTVLAHAMMAAIAAAGLALACGLAWLLGAATLRRAASVVLACALGLALAGWWLLPSLSGGITEINAAAITEALATVPVTTHLNPLARRNPEAVSLGPMLLLGAALALAARPRPLPAALALAGLVLVALGTPAGRAIYELLPAHHLLWPLRFLSLASALLLLGVALWLRQARRLPRALPALLLAAIAADSARSLPLIHQREPRPGVVAAAAALEARAGWRVAALDLSRLGAEPSFRFPQAPGREYVQGWAYQGARAAATVAALNEAVEAGDTAFLVDRFDRYGVDDVALLRELPHAPAIAAALEAAGYTPTAGGPELTLYQREGWPRAVILSGEALVIGRGGPALAARFPQLTVGTSPFIEDYPPEQLRRARVLVLAGFSWRDRAAAEARVREAAVAGVRVIVDLTGAPEDPWARAPRFLGVWGEPIVVGGAPLTLAGPADQRVLAAPTPDPSWHTLTPQGLDEPLWRFDYLGQPAVAAGLSRSTGAPITFLGLNLPELLRVTRDAEALALLAELLELPPDTPGRYRTAPFAGYSADAGGTRFTLTLDAPAQLLVPIAVHDGTVVSREGEPITFSSAERMLLLDLPAGTHPIRVSYRHPPVYFVGLGVSLGALVLLAGWLLRGARAVGGAR